jgi:hypothetical protein
VCVCVRVRVRVCACVRACVCVCAGILLRDQRFCDCAEAYKAGHNISGVYYIYISNMTEPTQVNK